MTRLAILSSHPIQYYGPLFRRLAGLVEVEVLFAHKASPDEQARAGFGTPFDWDVDITSGYPHRFLTNVATRPGTDRFDGCDTPEIGPVLRAGRCDALLVMGWHLKCYVQAVFAAKRQGLPVMVRGDSHIETPRSSMKKLAKALAYPALLQIFDAALYVGQRSRAYYSHYRYPESRLFFSPHCVDNDWFAERATDDARRSLRAECGIAENVPVALFAGKLVPFKRPGDLVEAAYRMRSQGSIVEIMVAGDGELRGPLQALAAERGVPLHLLGFCNQSRMPAAYAASDVMVLPSDGRETWGLVANEAIACGRPIVVSETCGCAADLCGPLSAGTSFPVGDVDALSDVLARTLTMPPSRHMLRDTARRHSTDAASRGVIEALSSLAATHSAKAGVT